MREKKNSEETEKITQLTLASVKLCCVQVELKRLQKHSTGQIRMCLLGMVALLTFDNKH